MKRSHALLVGSFIALLTASAAQADVVTFQPSGSNRWADNANWTPAGEPDEADRAVIPQGEICVIDQDDAISGTIEVRQGAELLIEAGAKLTLENNEVQSASPNGPTVPGPILTNSKIESGGRVVLEATGSSTAATLHFKKRPHTVSGEGRLLGVSFLGNSAKKNEILIDQELLLTNAIATMDDGFRGHFIVKAFDPTPDDDSDDMPAYFRNEGNVAAQDPVRDDGDDNLSQVAVVTFDSTVEISDVSGARWIAAFKDTMVFENGALDLEGDFVNWDMTAYPPAQGCGTFEFNEAMKTCGTYRRLTCGGIDLVGQNTTFEYASFEAIMPNGCMNPASNNPQPEPTCNNPFEITSDVPTCKDGG